MALQAPDVGKDAGTTTPVATGEFRRAPVLAHHHTGSRFIRSLASEPQRLAISMACGIAVALGLIEIGVIHWFRGWTLIYFVHALLGIEFSLLGWVAWARRPGNRIGPLLVFAGLGFYAGGLFQTPIPSVGAVGVVLAVLPLAVCIHVLHAFPSGRLQGPSVPIVAGVYVVSLVLEIPEYLFGPPENSDGILDYFPHPDLFRLSHTIQSWSGLALMLATAWVLFDRLRAMDPARRRVLGPVLAYGFAAVLLQQFALAILPRYFGADPFTVFYAQTIVLAGIPLAFVACLLLGGFGRTSEIHELGTWLGSGPASAQDLTTALRRTLGDPTVEVLFWVRNAYVDADGRHRELEPEALDRGLVEIKAGAEPMGAITYDANLLTDRGVVETAGRVIALAVERERLTAQLLAARASLRTTLARAVESGDIERRRIARDLHDGLQSRLVLLGITAYQLEKESGSAGRETAGIAGLRTGLEGSIEELRRLVAGVMPPALLESGLFAAAEDFVSMLPLPAHLATSGESEPLPPGVESAAYFVLTEAVTNCLKHARASRLEVRIEREGDLLHVEVSDDGVGGATGARAGGLTGLADRVGALGGTFDVESVPGAGTRVLASVPCQDRVPLTEPA